MQAPLEPISAQARPGVDSPMGMRSDLVSMLMPFFPDDRTLQTFETEVGGYRISMHCEQDDGVLATPADRKILNLLAGAVAYHIRSGKEPSRHIALDTRTMVEALRGEAVFGGNDYTRVLDSLNRLMATVIETEMPLGDGISRRRRFRWIDAYEHDDKETPGGRRMLGLKISISEDAFLWMTRTLGFDITRERFQTITSTRSSIWRVYEICLAKLMSERGAARISLAELRDRIPLSSELKIFKTRTLRSAFSAVSEKPEMAGHLRLSLERQTENGFEEIDFRKRVRLESIFVRIRPGPTSLPALNRILPVNTDLDRIIREEEAP